MNSLASRVGLAVGALVLVCGLGAGIGGCSSSSAREAEDPILRALDTKQTPETRVAAVHEAFARAVSEADRIGARTELTPQIWSREANPQLKLAIVRELLAEKNEKALVEIREELRLNLPLQSTREVVAEVCRAAAERGWSEYVPAIVRTWSAPIPGIADEDRVERAAMVALSGDKPVEETVFSVFVSPPPDNESTKTMRLAEMYRLAAWEVLSRLDRRGDLRQRMLESVPVGTASAPRPPFVDDLLAARTDFGVMPGLADELRWLRRLRDGKSAANAAWWGQCKSAVAGMAPELRSGLEMRHFEPIRWAAANRPQWLSVGRDGLAAIVTERFKDRPVYEASGNRPSGRGRILESFADALPQMTGADMIALLVTDESVRAPGVAESLFTYAGYDERDTKTEYGGLIQAVDSDAAKPFIATLYAPRPGDRYDDRRFVASQDMIDASDRALVQWHFHVADRSNSAYAGPSLEDLDYAGRQGRTCVVFTSLDSKRLNADYFQRGGIIVDMGLVEKPSER